MLLRATVSSLFSSLFLGGDYIVKLSEGVQVSMLSFFVVVKTAACNGDSAGCHRLLDSIHVTELDSLYSSLCNWRVFLICHSGKSCLYCLSQKLM